MKKSMFLLAVVAFAAAAYFGISSVNESNYPSLMMQNIEALAAGEGGGGGRCPTGGLANTRCPIWNISVVHDWSGPKINCITGGSYKCYEGKCPHGR